MGKPRHLSLVPPLVEEPEEEFTRTITHDRIIDALRHPSRAFQSPKVFTVTLDRGERSWKPTLDVVQDRYFEGPLKVTYKMIFKGASPVISTETERP